MSSLYAFMLLFVVLYNQVHATNSEDIEYSNAIFADNISSILSNELLQNFNANVDDETFCTTCAVVSNKVILYRRAGANKESMTALINELCLTYLDVRSPEVCRDLTEIFIDTILYIIDNKKKLTGEFVCSVKFQHRNCKDVNAFNWEIQITPRNSNAIISPATKFTSSAPDNLRILHLTDFHVDPLYKPGSNADCGLPLCCQEDSGPPNDSANAAGYWGDYHVCDIPWHTITDFAAHIRNKHKKIDMVYYTGDIISHRTWGTSKERNIKAIKSLYNLFKTTFEDIPFYPVLGNHEPHPVDFYSPGEVTNPKVTTQWVFDLAAEQWDKWLPKSTRETILNGGFYTVLVRPGFRIVALNSNLCYTSNLWLLYDDVDPYNQLKWLNRILTEAEINGEVVHILSHVPPGDRECTRTWTIQYKKIVRRFANIISAQFNGHTHVDELRVFYDSDTNPDKKVINVAFNGGSFTTFVGYNPNYRLYTVDSTYMNVLDYDHYIFNLTRANENAQKSPEWYKLYSFKDAYGLKGATMDDFKELVDKLSTNKTLLEQYFRFGIRESDVGLKQGCDTECLNQLLCAITAVDAQTSLDCQINSY